MKATFVELPAFDRLRATYLDDDDFAALQQLLMKDPDAGIQIHGTGGLHKGEVPDLTPEQRAALKVRIKAELTAKRRK